MIIALGFVNTQPSVTSKPGVWPRGSRYIRPSRQDSLIDSAYVMLYQVYNSSFDVLLFTWELQYGKILEVSMSTLAITFTICRMDPAGAALCEGPDPTEPMTYCTADAYPPLLNCTAIRELL
jgi:hypothetical protein